MFKPMEKRSGSARTLYRRYLIENVDVEVLGVKNDVIWKKTLKSTLYSPTGFAYTLPFWK
jgi:hypothetical protein